MGKKRIVMKDIAQAMNVSINTVSLALNNKDGLNEKTRQAIIAKAREMGYELPTGQIAPLDNIILLLDKRYTQDFSFYARVVYGVTQCANRHHYNVLVDFFDNEDPLLPPSVANKSVQGILVAGRVSDGYLTLLETASLPLVLIDYASLALPCDSVGTQNLQGGYQATTYLLDRGHRTIGFVGDIHYSFSLQERWLGFRACMESHAALGAVQDYAAYSITDPIAPMVIAHDCDTLVEKLRQLPALPTAFVCCNDETALCLYRALAVLGKQVGQDVSLIGFDDIEAGKRLDPPLTTLHVHKMQMGETAFRRLLARIKDPTLPLQCTVLPVDLVERASVRRMK